MNQKTLPIHKALLALIVFALLFSAAPAFAANTGFLSPSANALDTGGDNNGFESNPNNAHADGGGSAVNNNGEDDRHRYYNYGISIPAGETISGVEVRVDGRVVDSTSGTSNYIVELSWDGGASWTGSQTTGELSQSEQTFTLGGPSDDWGNPGGWTATELNNTNFRVRITSNCSGGGGGSSACSNRDFELDWIAVRVTYNTAPNAPTNTTPANGANLTTANPTFGWSAFSDPNASDTQSQFNIQLRQNPGSYTPTPFREATVTSTANTYTPSSWTLPDGNYCWRVRVRDNSNASNDWSAYSAETCFFTDSNPPASNAASPTLASTAFQVTASATDGGTGVANVRLWFRGPTGNWTPTGAQINAPGPYQWTFTPALGDGDYRFQSVACDNAGNCETIPSGATGNGDDTTTYDATAPASSATPPAGTVNAAPINIPWTATDATSGIATNGVTLYANFNGGAYTASGTASGGSGAFNFTPANGDGTYCFYTRATDNAGNVEAAPATNDGCSLYRTRATIGDRVWLDSNGNGLQDGGEPGLNGVTLTLLRGVTVVDTATTAGNGNYLFSDLQGPETVTVRDEFGSAAYSNNNGTRNWAGNWIETDANGAGPTSGSIEIVSSQLRLADEPDTGTQSNLAREVNLSGSNTATLSFDFSTSGSLESDDQIVVEVSSNGGGSYTVLETFANDGSGSRNYDISAYMSSNTRVRFRVSANIGANGEYFTIDNVQIQFQDVSQSTYTVVVDASNSNPGGPLFGYQPTDGLAAVSPLVVTVDIGQDVTSADFGYGPFALIGDLIYQDTDRDGAFDSGEPGLPNIAVSLYNDGNGNGRIDGGDAVVRTASTNANGIYYFGGITAGNYVVLADTSDPQLPPSFRPTSPNPATIPGVVISSAYLNADIGFNTPPQVIKPLYLRGTSDLTRTMPSAAVHSTRLINNNQTYTWTQSLALLTPVTIPENQLVQAILYIEAFPSTGAQCGGRIPDVTANLLQQVGTSFTTLGTAIITDMTPGLNTRTFTFNMAQATTIPTNARLALRLTVTTAGCTDPDAFGYIVVNYDAVSRPSRLDLPSVSYINLDQGGTFDAAFPAGAQTPTFIQGDTVYFRATASDPFGAFDISGASLTVPGFVNNTAMSLVASSALTRTFQSALPGLLGGNYSYIITATEGLEGQVSATITGTFSVIVSNLGNSTKTVDRVTAAPGDTLAYTIVLSNTGGLNANVRMTDTLPANVTYLSGPTGPAGASYNAGLNAILFNGVVPANGQVIIGYTARVNTPLDNGTLIANNATIADGFTRFDTSPPAVTTIQSAPNLSASTKSVDRATAAPGDTLEYTILLTNTGNMNAQVSAVNPLLDEVPANTTFNGGLFASAGNISYNAGFNRIEWYGTVPAGGSVTLRFRVRIAFPLDNGTPIVNTAVINEGAGFSNPQTYNRTATTNVVSAPNLAAQSAKLVDRAVAAPGDLLAYTILLRNTGNMNAPNVTLTDTLPANVTWGGDPFMSATSGAVTFDPGTRTLTWQGDMNAGVTVQILFRATVNSPLPNNTQLVNTARVSDAAGAFTPFTLSALTTVQSSPNLSASTKTVNAATAAPGTTLTYTLTLINTGNAVATTALTDTLPAELQSPVLVSASSGAAQVVGAQVRWSGLVTPTVNVVIVFRATLLPVLNNGTQVANTAQVNDGVNTPFFISPAAVTTINSSPSLVTSIKRVDRATAAPGDLLVYTIYLTNTGNMAADTVVRDVLPANVTFNGGLSASPGAPLPTYSSINNRVSWQGSVVPGTPITVSYQVRINTPLDNGLQIQNDAEINDSIHPPFDTDPPAETTIVSAPDLSTSSKAVDLTSAAPGDLLHYTIRLVNTGNMIATGVALSDTLPAEVTFASGVFVTGGGAASYVGPQRRVTWNGSVAPGSDVIVEYYVTVNTPLPNGASIVNDAAITGSFPAVTTNAVTTIVSSDHALTLNKIAPSIVAAGQNMTYTLNWSVTGNEPATNVVITDAIPLNTTYVSCLGGVSCSQAGGVVTWNVGNRVPGNSGSVTFVVAVSNLLPNGTVIDNTANIFDNENAPVSGSASTTVSSGHGFSLAKSDTPDPAQAGAPLVYTLNWATSGTELAQSVVITDAVPANTTYVSCTGGVSCSQAGGSVTWNLGNQNPNASGAVTLTVNVASPLPNGTLLTNSARISDGNGGIATTDTEQTTVNSSHALNVEKAAPASIAAGARLTYTIPYTVTGNETAQNLIIEDATPPNTTFFSASGAPTIDNPGVGNSGTVRWRLGNVTPGASGTVTLVVTVNSPLPSGTVINNTASISDDNGGTNDVDSISTTVTSSHGFVLTKTDTPDPTTPNGFINYTIHWEVTGNEAATNVVITDTIPANTTFSNCGACVLQAGYVSWDLGARNPGASGDVFVQVRVDTPLPNNTLISNFARISDSNGGTVATATASTTVNSNHALALNKSAPSIVSAGQTLTYTLNWSVTGDEPAPSVVITDAIPANTTFASCTGGCTPGGVLTWNLGNLVPGNSGTVTFVVNVSGLLANGTPINNTARISDADGASAQSSTLTTVSSGHGFTLDKRDTGYDPVQAGGTLVYNIDWSLSGTEAATSVVITDAVPANTTYVSCSPAACSQAGGIVTWNLGNRTPGSTGTAVMTVTVNSPLPNGTLLTNVTRISDANGGLPTTDTEQTTVNASHALNVTKTAPATVAAGGQITYTINWSVTGNETAQNLIIEDTTPNNTTFARASGAPTIDNPGVGSAGLVRWRLGNQPPGASGAVILVVNVNSPLPNGTAINNTASISDSNGGATASSSASTSVGSGHGFTLTKIDTPDPTTPDGVINYTINWSVTGSEVAQNIVLTDTIPANTTFSNCGACVLQAGFVRWDLGARNPGESGSVFVQVRVNTPLPNNTVISNFARISDGNGGAPATATSSTTVNSNHQLTLSKTAPSAVQAGQTLTYTLNWSVTGDEPAPSVVITDAIPANTTFASCTGGCTSGGVLTWNLGNLAPGNSGTVTFIVNVSGLLANGTVITNTARISDADNASAQSTATTTVGSGHGFTLTKSDTPDPVQAGAPLVYTINWTTSGTEVAQNVVITDAVPANTSYVSCTGGVSCGQAGGVVTWNLGNQNPNTSGAVTLTVNVASPLPNLTLLTNLARISDANGGAPTTDTEQTIVQSGHALNVTKTAPATVSAGGQISYNIAWSVTGNETAQNLIIEDSTPPNTTFASASGAATIDNPGVGSVGMVRWRLGNQPPGSSGTVTLVVNVNSPLPNGTAINNTAAIVDGNGGATDTSSVSTQVNSSHAFVLAKFDTPDPIMPGGILNYTIHWEVTGNEAAQAVVITDSIPANTSFWSCGGCALQGGFVRWNLGAHNPGDSGDVTLQVTVNTPLPDGASINNTARISDGNGGAPLEASATTTVTSDHNLAINKSGPTAAAAGSQIVYTIDYLISGTEIAPSVIITDAIPAGTSYVANSCQPLAVCAETGGVVTWTLGDLPPGSTGSVQFSVRADAGLPNGTNVVNTAYISDSDGKSASDSVTTRIGSEANLTLADGRTTVQPGERITYTINFNGAEPLNNGRIQLDLPVNTTLVSASSGYVNASTAVFWLLAPQPPGFSGQRTVVVQVDPVLDNGTIISTTAYLSGDGQSTNATEDAVVVSAPSWSTALKLSDRPAVEPSSRLTYTLMLSNTGNMHAHVATLADPLPPQVTFVNGSLSATGGAASYDSGANRVLWNGSVSAGTTVKVVFAVTVNADVPPGTTIVNSASVDDEVNAAVLLSNEVNTVAQEPRTYSIYLPMLTRGYNGPELPDLTITNVTVTPAVLTAGVPGWDVQITVKNIGTAPLPGGVWMDLYIDPVRAPEPNTPFFAISPGPYGAVWWIPQLNPGESIVLSKDDILPDWLSFFPNSFNTPGQHTLYVQIDSLDERTANPPAWARVYEMNENNNIYGPKHVQVNPFSGGAGSMTIVQTPSELPLRQAPD